MSYDIYDGTVLTSHLISAFSEWRIERDDIEDSPYPELAGYMRALLKNKTTHLVGVKEGPTGIIPWIGAIFVDIKSITEEAIVFDICDGTCLSSELCFNRQKNLFYRMEKDLHSTRGKKVEYRFTEVPDDTYSPFYKLIRKIEQKY